MQYRIQKLISLAGIASRRRAEMLIESGRVKINHKKAYIGDKGDPEKDNITVDGNALNLKVPIRVILVNKPKGIISTCHDPYGRKTILDLLPTEMRNGFYPVGRLDKDSRGAILITNNGKLTLKLTHPKFHHKKTYQVWIKGIPSIQSLKKWEVGIMLDNKKTLPAKVDLLKLSKNKSESLLNVVLSEGRKRQIRRIAELLGHPVTDLKRISIENICLDNLKEGSWRELKDKEWNHLLIQDII